MTNWEIFNVSELADSQSTDSYLPFFNVPTLSLGIYKISAGSQDMQSPHDDDEVYYVLSGSARVQVGDDVRDVGAGDLLYVRATESHHFFEVKEDMTLLVVFASGPDGE